LAGVGKNRSDNGKPRSEPQGGTLAPGGGEARAARIERMIGPAVEALGCTVWGVELVVQGRKTTLVIYIDREQGVSIEDCEAVSHQVSGILDVEDPIAGAFTLEVSSPGLDRILFKLEQYAESVGETLDVRLREPFEGRRRVRGRLAGIEDGDIVLHVDDAEYLLPLEWIQRARIVPRFD